MRISLITLIVFLSLSGCSSLGIKPPLIPDDVAQSTTATNAVGNDDESDNDGLFGLRRVDPEPGDPSWAPIYPVVKPEIFSGDTGSLFSQRYAKDLYNGDKPKAIGDIVTVLLKEKTQAQKSASSDKSKSNDLNLDPISIGGQNIKIGDSTLSYTIKNDNKTAGTTSADQSNSITGSISVEVIDVLNNGNLLIRGEKWLTLNTGDEYIRLSGMIRPQDISDENTIASTRISNARIQYSGTGAAQDTQDESWLARFFNVVL